MLGIPVKEWYPSCRHPFGKSDGACLQCTTTFTGWDVRSCPCCGNILRRRYYPNGKPNGRKRYLEGKSKAG